MEIFSHGNVEFQAKSDFVYSQKNSGICAWKPRDILNLFFFLITLTLDATLYKIKVV